MASVTIIFGGQEVSTHELTEAATIVGRDESADIRIDNLGISRNHCQFIRRGATYILQDMNSANGTYVGGKRVGEHYLNNDDRALIGKYELVFKNDAQTAAAESSASPVTDLPETMNTYVMDGAKIKEKLAEMRGEKIAPVTADSAPVSAAAYGQGKPDAAPSTQKLEALASAGMGLKIALVISIIINVALLVLYLMKT